ncbi:MAG TPA: HAMP domain-containing sensor histidine kinase [Planctomycetota bacterium]
MERFVPFPLRRKLGLFALGLFTLLAGVCAVGMHQFVALRTDARRLLEESRELALANDLEAHFESIGLMLAVLDEAGDSPEPREFLRMQIRDVRAILHAMDDAPGQDPSRSAHQAEELELTRALDARMAALDQRVEARLDGEIPLDLEAIAEMRQTGEDLEEEAREEAEHAEADLRERSRSAVRVMLITVAVAALGFVGLLWVVLHNVVRPLRLLERRAEALGRGDFRPGTALKNRDEIGALARAFDEMAARVAATQSALEERVATKTRELARAARYADLGVLAAGVAHEINNPLATIATAAEGMQRRLERGTLDPKEETEYFRTIASEAYRARDITQRLLTLARADPAPHGRVVVATLLQELQRVTRHQLERRSVRLEIEAPAGLAVRGNSGELLQALVNLVLNARDASPAGKLVRVEAAREGGFAVLDVDDEGSGVPPELVERVFEPFFTTKPPGEGTGLGLSLVAAIVEGHGGTVAVARSPAGGARFRVRIPLDAQTPPRP